MINDLINKYASNTVIDKFGRTLGAISDADNISILNSISNYLESVKYEFNPKEIENKMAAMYAFFEMFARKIGGDNPAVYGYYFSSIVANDKSLSPSQQLQGNKIRAFITFKHMDKWSQLFMVAIQGAPIAYSGNLNYQSFVDIIVLSDVYKAWDSDPHSQFLAELKRQAPSVERLHPELSKQQVIIEGDLAHKSILSVIESIAGIE